MKFLFSLLVFLPAFCFANVTVFMGEGVNVTYFSGEFVQLTADGVKINFQAKGASPKNQSCLVSADFLKNSNTSGMALMTDLLDKTKEFGINCKVSGQDYLAISIWRRN